MSYIAGSELGQHALFPSTLDEYISGGNPVRAIAAFIEALDFEGLGFVRARAADTGRPGYDPRQLLGLYLWGHLNRVRTSRKLERECGRNLEAMWLMHKLEPDFKTIADFRKNNGEAIKQVVVRFRLWCMSEDLYGQEVVAIDGSKFKAQNNSERNFTQKKLAEVIKREQKRIEKYLQELDENDAAEEGVESGPPLSAEELQEKLKRLKEKLAGHEKLLQQMKAEGVSQVSLTDAEGRLMKSSKGTAVSYNVQTVIDSKHKLIVAYEVTNEGNDLKQLSNMAKQAKQALGVEKLTVLSDGGYFDGERIKECETAAITPYLPVPESGAAKSRGLFPATRFSYDAARDVYVCPQGAELTFRGKEKGSNKKEYRLYRTAACAQCAVRGQCTKAKKLGRKIRRWVNEDVLDRLKERIRDNPELLKLRKELAEHPFGTIKLAMDQGYFLLKGITKVTTEFSLTVLSYNFKRVLSILGPEGFITSMKKATA